MQSGVFREVLAADVAVELGIVSATQAADALAHYWETGEEGVLRDVSAPDRSRVESEVARLLEEVEGDARTAVAQRGVMRDLHASLAPEATHALADAGATVRSSLRPMDRSRYLGFMPLAEGGMGVVYLALDSELNRRVAFKMIRAGTTDPLAEKSGPVSSDMVARFMQEAVVTGGLEHPGIVPVYELGATPSGVPFYTMRLIRGERTLDDAITEARSIDDRLALLEPFLKVCDAIGYAHSRGVIHRDIKPANIAMGQFGEVVVLDWGLAKMHARPDLAGSRWQSRLEEMRVETDLKTVTSALGTPGYMAPEAAFGETDRVDERSDVYSLGTILYLILKGAFPFEFKTFPEYVAKLAKGVTSISDVPDGLARICMRAMAVDRDGRYQSVSDLAADLRTWQYESAVEREIEALLTEAEATLAAAIGMEGDVLLRQLDRAIAVGARILDLRPDDERARTLRERARGRRSDAMEQHERATRRQLLRRVGVAALVTATAATVVVALLLDGKRREAETARANEAEQRAAAETQRNLAEDERARAEDMATFMLHDLHEGLKPMGRLDLLDTVARKSLDYYESLPTETVTSDVMRDRAFVLRQIGEVLFEAGDMKRALASIGESQSILVQLLERDRENAELRNELSVTLNVAGDIQQETAQLDAALASYLQSVAIRRALGLREPLARSLGRVGDVLMRQGERAEAVAAYQESLDTLRDLATLSPGDLDLHEELSRRIEKMGELALQTADLDTAEAEFRRCLVIRRRLVELDPANLERQADIASCVFRIGHCRGVVGDTAAALASYEEALSIYRRLVAHDPTNAWWQRSLGLTLRRVAAVQGARGETDAARQGYREALDIARAIASRDRTNTRARHDVGTALIAVGEHEQAAGNVDVARAAFDEALAVAHDLAESGPDNTEWKGDLYTALSRIGALEQSIPDLLAARETLTGALQVVRGLVGGDPRNGEWQRSVGILLVQLGDVEVASGDSRTAIADYAEALQIRRRLAQRDPENVDWQDDLAWVLGRLGATSRDADAGDDAARYFAEALVTHRRFVSRDPTPARRRSFTVALYNLGIAQQKLGSTAEALVTLREAENEHGGMAGYAGEHHFWETAYAVAVAAAGAETPRDHLALAYKLYADREYAKSTDHFGSAFVEDALRRDLVRGNLYNATCSAALAGDPDRAIAWLAADLALRRENMDTDALRAHLEHARVSDADLASLRGLDVFEALFE